MARRTRSRVRLTTATIAGLATGMAGLAAGLPVAAAASGGDTPAVTMEVLLSETGTLVDDEYKNLDWRDGALHVMHAGNNGGAHVVSITAEGTRRTTPVGVPGSAVNGFAAGPAGTFLLSRSYQNISKSEIVTVSPDGTFSAPTSAARIPSWWVGELAAATDDTSVYFGTTRYPDNGGAIQSLPLPVPADQSAPNQLVSFSRFSIGGDLYLADGKLYQLESGADPLRVFDAQTGAQTAVLGNGVDDSCNTSPGQWDGADARSASFCNPTAVAVDSRGDIFVAASLGYELYRISVDDNVMHWIAGGYEQVGASTGRTPRTGDDARTAQFRINDLAIDDAGNLYLSSAWNHYGRADEHTEVIRFPGIAPAPTPLAPTGLAADSGDGLAVVSFTAPTDTGRGPLTGFVATAHPHGAADASADVVVRGASSPLELTGLVNGTSYDVTVAATNEFGDGPAAGPVTVTPRAPRALLVADATSGVAPLTVRLDASGSTAPDGATFQFFCGDSHDPEGAPSAAATATCIYDRQSPEAGWNASVVMHDPGTGRDYQDTEVVTVDPEPGTVDGSRAFDTSTPAADLPVAADGSLDSDSCGPDVAGVTCTTVDGVEIRLAAAPGTFRPGTRVFIHSADAEELQSEHGDAVVVQGGFGVTWEPRYDLTQPLVITIPDQPAPAARRTMSGPLDGIGRFLSGIADGLTRGAGQVTQTIGSGLSSLGTALSTLWATAAQSVERPNGSDVNDVITCSRVETQDGTTYCHGPYTRQRAVPTSVLASLETGGTFIPTRAGQLVLNGGGHVISAGGGNVVSAGSGNIVVNTSAVISAGGGNVVSAGGGNVISAGGGNVVSAGGLNLIAAGSGAATLTIFRDPGFSVVGPVDPTPPTVTATLTPSVPGSGVYPAGTEVSVRLEAVSGATPPIAMRHIGFSASGADATPYTLVPGDSAVVEIDQAGVTTLQFGARDAQLNEAPPQLLEVRIAAPVRPASAPTGVVAERLDNTSARVSWSAPADLGAPSLTGYAVQVSDLGRYGDGGGAAGDRVVVFDATGTSQTVDGLTPGHRYRFSVRGFHRGEVSGRTDGALSEESAPVVTATTPSRPGDPAATAGDGSVSLTWAAPDRDGGLPVVGYRVVRGDSADGPFTSLTPTVVTTTTYVDSTAANGTTYYYAVIAENALGASDRSGTATATPRRLVAPTSTTLVAGSSPTAHEPLTWTATVSPTPSGGTVTFAEPGASAPLPGCSAVALAGGVATCTTTYRAVGAHELRATYSGTERFGPSTSELAAVDVAPARQSITFPELPPLVHGDPATDLDATASSGLPVSYATTTPGVCTIAADTLREVGAGRCTVIASQGGGSGYAAAPDVSRTVEIAKAPLTVIAGDAVMVAGGPVPSVEPTYAGFVDGETEADLDLPPTCVAAVDARVTRCSDAEDADYSIGYEDGALTVMDDQVTITVPQTVSYADRSVPVSATALSGLPVVISAAPQRRCQVRDGMLVVRHAGTCEVTATEASGPVTATRLVTIHRADLTIAASRAVWLDGRKRPRVAPVFSGFVRGDNVFSLRRPPTCGVRNGETRCWRAGSGDYRMHYRPGRLVERAGGHAFRSAPYIYALVGQPLQVALQVVGPTPVRYVVRGGRSLPPGVKVERDEAGRPVGVDGTPTGPGEAVLKVRAVVKKQVVATQRLVVTVHPEP